MHPIFDIASSRDEATRTGGPPSDDDVDDDDDDAPPPPAPTSTAPPRLRTTLIRPGSGRNFGGMDSHVLRPMITAFVNPGDGGVHVTSLKCLMSPGSRHGCCG